jgi:short-subunit dehydrogenase
MNIRLKPVQGQVIVITGASSGIGLATALMAAEQGAKLVLASRNGEALARIEHQIVNKGGEAIHVVADVASREDVERIARAAIDRFGTIDTWVNNAGIGTFGRIDQIPLEDHRRLFETNFWGIVNGSLVAVEHLRHKGGALINLGSEVSDVGLAMQGMYSASKHAIKGFTESLRMELENEHAPISVTLIKPAAINTPFFEHAKNFTGKEPNAPAPVYAPEEVATAILAAASKSIRDVYVGGASKMMSSLRTAAPKLADWLGSKAMVKAQFQDKPQRHHNDNLHQAGQDGHVNGEDVQQNLPSLYTRATLHPAATGAAVAGLALGVGVVSLLLSRRAPDRIEQARKAVSNLRKRS